MIFSDKKLTDFLITKKFPPINSDFLQLYSLATPNGVKISIMLEETSIAYDAHRIDISKGETYTKEFLEINPNSKIPTIIDPNGPEGKLIVLFESGAILLYLAEKSGRFLPKTPELKYKTLQWLFLQVASIGPMFGQFGYFYKFAGREIEDKRPLTRYLNEVKRLLKLLDDLLTENEWICGNEYTIADIAILGWIENLINFYDASEIVEYKNYPNLDRWLKVCMARPAVQKGLKVPN